VAAVEGRVETERSGLEEIEAGRGWQAVLRTLVSLSFFLQPLTF